MEPPTFASAIKCHQKSTSNSAGSSVGSLAPPRATPRLGGVYVDRASTSLAPLYSPCASWAFDWGSKPNSRSAPAPVESSPGPVLSSTVTGNFEPVCISSHIYCRKTRLGLSYCFAALRRVVKAPPRRRRSHGRWPNRCVSDALETEAHRCVSFGFQTASEITNHLALTHSRIRIPYIPPAKRGAASDGRNRTSWHALS